MTVRRRRWRLRLTGYLRIPSMLAYSIDATSLSLGLLIGRVTFGLLMAAHGAQKVFGWFGGHGLKATGNAFAQLGFDPPVAAAALAGLGEIGSGLVLAVGFLGPVGPASMISIMIVAMLTVHVRNGLFAMNNGIELPLLYALAALVFAFTGFGQYSLDGLLGFSNSFSGVVTWVSLGVGAAMGVLAARARTPVAAAQ
jgi:putative oxidoreductase